MFSPPVRDDSRVAGRVLIHRCSCPLLYLIGTSAILYIIQVECHSLYWKGAWNTKAKTV